MGRHEASGQVRRGVVQGLQRQAEGLRGEAEGWHRREAEGGAETPGGLDRKRHEGGQEELDPVAREDADEDGEEGRALRREGKAARMAPTTAITPACSSSLVRW